jgi:hypothetical protein
VGHEIARLEGVVLVRGVHRPLDREWNPLDSVALETEVGLAETRGKPRAQDLEFALLEREAELDAVPVNPSDSVTLAGGDGGKA